MDKLTSFLTRHNACIEGVSRLDATGAATYAARSASWSAAAAADAADAARADAAADAVDATAREAQAKWIRDNFVLNELNIN